MIAKSFEDITFSDLEGLLDNQVAEGKTIEYKREIVTNASSDKDPFLAGISAFANTIGGDFIVGIEATKGIPVNLMGATYANADDEILKLEQFLQTGLEPRLPSVQLKEVRAPDQRKFIIVRVARSWISPHKVRANEKFYGRNSKGKYPLDVSELRTAFMLSEQITERIKNFRAARINKIKQDNELPAILGKGGKLVFHLIPLSAFSTQTEIDVVNSNNLVRLLRPIASQGWDDRINLDGILTFSISRQNQGRNISYAQLFRNGIIETVVAIDELFDKKLIASQYYEQELLRCLKNYLEIFSMYKMEMPIYAFVSFVDVWGYVLMVVNSSSSAGKVLDRQDMILPERTITSYETNPIDVLLPIFNMVWNAFGYKRSFNFDEQGKWISI